MTQDYVMHRLSDANPVPAITPSPGADDLFARIVAQPGDARLASSASSRRGWWRAKPRRVGAAIAVSLLAAAGGSAAVVAGVLNSPSAANPPEITVSGAHAQEVAFIVKHVRARLTAAGGPALVTESSSLNGSEQDTSWQWTDPQTGINYQRSTTTDPTSGAVTSTYWSEMRQTSTQADGQVVDTGNLVNIDNRNGTYTEGPTTLTYTPGQSTAPSLTSSASEIAQALTDGTVSQTGTTTVNGTPAIVLSVSGTVGLTLDVDATTDQPLRAVLSNPINRDNVPITVDLLPATAANVAQAQQPAIPAGYTLVTDQRVGTTTTS
jgi:hypothetical protein